MRALLLLSLPLLSCNVVVCDECRKRVPLDQVPPSEEDLIREKRRAERAQRRFEREQARSEGQEQRQQRRERLSISDEHSDSFGNEEKKIVVDVFGSLFPIRKPRDVIQGSIHAIQSALMGLFLSTASLLGIPLVGYYNGGKRGGIAGFIVGSIVATVVALVSATNALYHLVAGILNTPSALLSTLSGKTWDSSRDEWIVYNLTQEDAELQSRKRSGTFNHVALYDLLQVAPDAPAGVIKKAYYRKAKELHPDKNSDNKEANEAFVRLRQAYDTLSNDKLREDYDRFGTTAAHQQAFDASVFFAALLDVESVEPFVGELRISFYVDKLQEFFMLRQNNITQESLETFAEGWGDTVARRQVDIAKNLLDFVQDFVDERITEEEFTKACRHEANKISESTFGNKFLEMIGYTLSMKSGAFLGYSSPFAFPIGLYSSAAQSFRRSREKLSAVKHFTSYANLRIALISPRVGSMMRKAAMDQAEGITPSTPEHSRACCLSC